MDQTYPSIIPIGPGHPKITEEILVSDWIMGCPVLTPTRAWSPKMHVLGDHALARVRYPRGSGAPRDVCPNFLQRHVGGYESDSGIEE